METQAETPPPKPEEKKHMTDTKIWKLVMGNGGVAMLLLSAWAAWFTWDKAKETKKLTEQVKKMAVYTVKAFIATGGNLKLEEAGVDGWSQEKEDKAFRDLLILAGQSPAEIDAILQQRNNATKKP